jgi:hypothetical protein
MIAIILYYVKYPRKSRKSNKHWFGGVLQFVNKYQLQFRRISYLVIFNNILQIRYYKKI